MCYPKIHHQGRSRSVMTCTKHHRECPGRIYLISTFTPQCPSVAARSSSSPARGTSEPPNPHPRPLSSQPCLLYLLPMPELPPTGALRRLSHSGAALVGVSIRGNVTRI